MAHAVSDELISPAVNKFLNKIESGKQITYQTICESLTGESADVFDLLDLVATLEHRDISLKWNPVNTHVLDELGWSKNGSNGNTQSNTENSVEQYFQEVAGHKILRAEEEVTLFRELERGKQWFRELVFLTNHFNEQFREAMVELDEGSLSVKDVLDISRSTAVSDDEERTYLDDLRTTADDARNYHAKIEQERSRDGAADSESRIRQIRRELISSLNNHDFDESFIENNSPGSTTGQRRHSTSNQRLGQALDLADAHWRIHRDKIATSNLKLVLSIAKKFKGKEMAFSDLIQEGNLGLLKAIRKFEHEKGYKFSTYATWWIRQSIQRAIQDKGSNIRIPVHRREKIDELFRARQSMKKELHREPTDEELADKLNWNLDYVRKVLNTQEETASLESHLKNGESDTELKDMIASDEESPRRDVDRKVLREAINSAMDDLTWRERQIIRMRYGLDKQEKQTLEEIGQHFNITRERTRQVEINGLEKLKHPERSKTLREFLKRDPSE